MKIAYICTNYNNSDYTEIAVKSLMSNVCHDIKIYVVDNASRSDDFQKLINFSHSIPTMRVIRSDLNVGYFSGLNLGLRYAKQDDSELDWFIVGNNDLEFPSDFCSHISSNQDDFFQYPIISPDIVTLDGQHQNPHVISDISSIREFIFDLYFSNYYFGLIIYKLAKAFPYVTRRGDEDQWQTSRTIYQGHGSCYLLTPKFFEMFDELWSPTFMMSEEFFLSHQLNSVGEKVFYSPKVCVKHHCHGSLKDIPSKHRWKMARDAHREYRKYVKIFKGTGK